MKKLNKYFTFFYRLTFAHFTGTRIPLWATINITHRCNQACIYCDLPKKKPDRNKQYWFKIIDSLKAKKCSVIGFMGAEPLLHLEAESIINYAVDKNFIVNLYSNGSFNPGQHHIVKMVDHLFISLDGEQQTHDFNRGKNTYNRAIRALKETKGLTQRTIICTLTNTKLPEIDFLVNLAKDYDSQILFQSYTENLDAKKLKSLNHTQTYQIFNYILKLKKENYPISNSTFSLKQIRDGKIFKTPCLGGKRFIDIAADGDVYPCFEGSNREELKINTSFENPTFTLESFRHKQCDCHNSCGIDINNILTYNLNSLVNACLTVLKTARKN